MLSKNLEMTLHRALAIARQYRHEYATLEHLLLALTEDPDAGVVLRGCGASLIELRQNLCEFLENELTDLVVDELAEAKPTAGFQRVIHRAAIHVQSAGKREVTGANVLVALFSERDSHAVYFLQEQDIARIDIVNYISHGIVKYTERPAPVAANEEGSPEQAAAAAAKLGAGNANAGAKEKEKEESSALAKYCQNLNKRAAEGRIDVLVGREEEIERTIQILCRRRKNNPLLVGEAGVGKTAIAEGLALRIVKNNVPEVLKKTVIFSLDMGALMAGTRYRGDFEERMKQVIHEVEKLPQAVLFIDEIHTVIGAGSTSGGALDAGNLLKPALARGNFRCMGSTTYGEYRTSFEKDRALARRFQKIDVKEPSVDDTVKILRGLKPYYEEHHQIRYTLAAVEAAANLSARFITDRKLPDKAIDVLDEAGASQMLLPESRRRKVIGVREIEDIVAKIARMPAKSVSADDAEKLRNLEGDLKLTVFGQDKAIEALASAVKMARAGLREMEKPIGNYLFTGPTGVGKTEVAKALAHLMGMELIRFDMSEYMEKHAVARLIGSPPGYVGFEQGGLLTEAVDRQPYCVLLLDEIEKAHPDIYNILLQVMDYGSLTDNNGKTVNFRNAIIIMTSNAGAAEISKTPIGFGDVSRAGEDQMAIQRVFTPEFRNRLDAIIGFAHLEKEVVGMIVNKFIFRLEEQLSERNITITLTAKARDYLCDNGYDRSNGARPLARLIQEEIKKPLADEVLFGKLSKGGNVAIGVDKAGSKLTFSYRPEKVVAKGKGNKKLPDSLQLEDEDEELA
ncbi:ATP-dependent Clp protease ATP-binding subunit ClpA [bacterium]|nr:ATP-dependent Clp protease ATP-binding subunit ClpA [bacterium]